VRHGSTHEYTHTHTHTHARARAHVSTYMCVCTYTCVCTYREKRRSVAIIETRISLIVQPKEKKKLIRTGVLPAVRHLTVTLSSRELHRFRLVFLLISNECSSLVAVLLPRRIYAFARALLSPFVSFSIDCHFFFFPFSCFFLSLSLFLTLIARRFSPFYFWQSRPPSERNGSFARSLGRALAHPSIAIHRNHYSRGIPDRKIKYSPMHRSVDWSCISCTQCTKFPTTRTNARTADTDLTVRSYKCSFGSAYMRLLSL